MTVSEEKFVAEWGDALAKNQASVFVGSGVSAEARYPTWSTLLEDCVTELGIKLHRHDDLSIVAQHYLNEGGNRAHQLWQAIKEGFPPVESDRLPRSLKILARLPLRTVWTTNYDKLVEQAWREQGLEPDVKRKQADIHAVPPSWTDMTLYKMHGCMDDLASMVIAKDHYDLYAKDRDGFFAALAADLVGKRMLFLGFGHRDPNLAFVFSTLRRMFGDGAARHFSVARRPKAEHGEEQAEVDRRFDLWTRDWEVRYGVRVVEVSNWDAVPSLLERVERRTVRDAVLVSGSLPEDATREEREMAEAVARGLGEVLPRENMRLVSGFGLTVGSAVLSGLMSGLNTSGRRSVNLDRHVLLRPFPQPSPGQAPDRAAWMTWRHELVNRAGVAIFVAGAKRDESGALSAADGAIEEFRIILETGRVPIPVGATGLAAARIWQAVQSELPRWPWYPKDAFAVLNDTSRQPNVLVNAVVDILRAFRKSHTT